ncbi:MAG TPA: saccharopine dehydrogenase C-terminal domain-containing protein [Chitinophagaceae bacterium]|nr:saccharopine dehydrogenase C-terminal domain-containing protein [Chitinophagaceae bacterium]
MKQILIFGAGKSATVLIEFLIAHAPKNKWHLTVVDSNLSLVQSKTGKSYFATPLAFDIQQEITRRKLVENSDLVISLLPPSLHLLIAQDCLLYQKHLLTASYADQKIQKLGPEIRKAGLLFVYEMGLDPGLDHMSAMNLIHSIKRKGGLIRSFRSFCGGLMDPSSNDNPWSYKISWNPANVVLAGKSGATFKDKGKIVELCYEELFDQGKTIQVSGLGKLAYYPNRDSLNYMKLYQLEESETFLRATLRFPEFCEGWNALVRLGLTDDKAKVNTDELPYFKWASQKLKNKFPASSEESFTEFLGTKDNSRVITQLKFLGFLNGGLINQGERTNAEILQSVLENKLKMLPDDHDLVVMQHEIRFERCRIETCLVSSLMITGENSLNTAMAKTVGLPLGIMAKLILTGKMPLIGLHIPIVPEIYQPVLKELEEQGIRFEERFE